MTPASHSCSDQPLAPSHVVAQISRSSAKNERYGRGFPDLAILGLSDDGCQGIEAAQSRWGGKLLVCRPEDRPGWATTRSTKLTRRAVSLLADTRTDAEAVAQWSPFDAGLIHVVDGVTVRTWGDDAQICPTGYRVVITHPPSSRSQSSIENCQAGRSPGWEAAAGSCMQGPRPILMVGSRLGEQAVALIVEASSCVTLWCSWLPWGLAPRARIGRRHHRAERPVRRTH